MLSARTPLDGSVDADVAARFVLFLDFDGVLQTPSAPHWEEMGCTTQAISLLSQYPDLAVVVTSTHREGKTLADIRCMLPPAIASRVIGATPVLALGRARRGRLLEIEAWLAAHPCVTDWLAVDDEVDLFGTDCARLVRTEKLRGWDGKTSAQVHALLGSSRNLSSESASKVQT